ncbi:MAG: hypothetical protein Q9226_004427 [Calogaya cf. arnoldii]
MYSIPPSPTALIINGSPSPLSFATSLLNNNSTIPGKSAGNDKSAGSPKDEVAADAQQQPGDAINPPSNPPSNNEATAPSNNQASADLPLPPGGTTNPPGKTTTNNEPAPPKAQDVANPQAQIASLIMNAFGPAIGSAVPGIGSPKADSPSATIGKPPSRFSRISDSAVPLNPTTIDNVGTAGSPPSPQRESAVNALPYASPMVVAGKTLQPGSSITVSGTTYALPSQATEILVNETPSPLPVPLGSANKVSANTGGRPVDAVAAAIYSITPGAPAIIVSGTTYSRLSTGTEIFVNGSPSPVPVSLINTGPFQSMLLFGSQTLQPGEVMTVSGKVISGPTTYPSSPTGTAFFINGSPSPIPTITSNTTPIQPALVIASQTLRPGAAITVSGSVFSLPATDTGKIVVDGQTAIFAEKRLGSGPGDTIVFTNGEASMSLTAALAETGLGSASVADAAISTSEAAESGSGNPSEATKSPNSEDSADGATDRDQGRESLAVKIAVSKSLMGVWVLEVGTLLAFIISL